MKNQKRIHIKSPPGKKRTKNRCTYMYVSTHKTSKEEREYSSLLQILLDVWK